MPNKRYKKCPVSFPMDPFVHHLSGLLIDRMREVNTLSTERDSVASALIVVPLINCEARDLSKQVRHLGVCLSFEAARLKLFTNTRLFDGMHVDVNPIHGSHSGCETIFTSRHSSEPPLVQVKMEAMEAAELLARENDTKLNKLLNHHDCPDLIDAPVCVRVFVGRVRHVSQYLTSTVASTNGCRVCGRETMLLEGEDDMTDYWETAGGLRPTESTMSVCCLTCKHVMVEEVNRAFCISLQELSEYDCPRDSCGNRRIAMALRAAFKRNEQVARRMRNNTTFHFLTTDEVNEAKRRTTTALNVDTGLLIACEKAITLPKFKIRVLPPCYIGWRSNRSIFLNPLLRAARIYHRHVTKQTTVLPHLMHRPKWVTKILEDVTTIFK